MRVKMTNMVLVALLGAPLSLLAAENETINASPAGSAESDTGQSSASAQQEGTSPVDGVVGKLGLGYFTNSAPLGIRYWFDRDTALDINADFALAGGGVEGYRVVLEGGLVKALASYHYAQVFGRIGVGGRVDDQFGRRSGQATWIAHANGFLGVELFMGALGFPNVSLQGGYGVEASYTFRGGGSYLIAAVNPGVSFVNAGTLGFHIYF